MIYSTLITAWQDPTDFCRQSIIQNTENPDGTINTQNLHWAQSVMIQVFDKYFQANQGIFGPGQE